MVQKHFLKYTAKVQKNLTYTSFLTKKSIKIHFFECLLNDVRMLFKHKKKAANFRDRSLLLLKFCCTFRFVKSALFVLANIIRNLENSQSPKTLQHFDVLGICISISIRTMRVCMCAYISAWASVLLVQVKRQFQGLE